MPLEARSFRRLWAGAGLSMLADQAFLVALTWLVLRVTGIWRRARRGIGGRIHTWHRPDACGRGPERSVFARVDHDLGQCGTRSAFGPPDLVDPGGCHAAVARVRHRGKLERARRTLLPCVDVDRTDPG